MNNKVTYEDILQEEYAERLKTKMIEKRDTIGLGQMKLFLEDREDYLSRVEYSIPKLVKIPKDNGKMRDIFTYDPSTSFVLKLISEVLNDKFNSEIHPSVFSYRKGIRIFTAVKNVQKDMDQGVEFMKVDISNYFIEVCQDKINNMISVCFEEGPLKDIITMIFNRNQYLYKGEIITDKLGIMPGNPISCIFSNLILKEIDVDMYNSTKSYTRYSDDIVIGGNSKLELDSSLNRITELLKDYNLEINPSKVNYYGKNDVEFLGLLVNSDKIDITKNKFKAIKRTIKINSRKYRKKVEYGKLTKVEAVEGMVREFNRRMYKPIVWDDLHIGLGGFIFSNITTMETLREIDFYFINQCRYVVTGKYNKANCRTVQFNELETMGYKSMCELYKISKMGKDIYINQIYQLA